MPGKINWKKNWFRPVHLITSASRALGTKLGEITRKTQITAHACDGLHSTHLDCVSTHWRSMMRMCVVVHDPYIRNASLSIDDNSVYYAAWSDACMRFSGDFNRQLFVSSWFISIALNHHWRSEYKGKSKCLYLEDSDFFSCYNSFLVCAIPPGYIAEPGYSSRHIQDCPGCAYDQKSI